MNPYLKGHGMQLLRRASAVCTLALVSGCAYWSVQADGNRWLPRSPRWEIGPKAPGGRETAAFAEARLYEWVKDDPHFKRGEYLIFWPSGHLLAVSHDDPGCEPTDYGRRWNTGSVGYYKLNQDSNRIDAQIYDYDHGSMGMVYRRLAFCLDGEAITPVSSTGIVRPYPYYTRQEVDITLRPDW